MEQNKKSFTVAIISIFVLMVLTYVLTLVLPCEGISFFKWLGSPILVLGSDSGITTIAIIIFLIVIGGISNALNKCGFMEYMLHKIVHKFGKRRYLLMGIIVFFLMALGSLIGSFEEVVPITPIVVALAVELGFDDLTGMAMSLLAVGCGFAAGVFNPFNIGVAQGIVGLPLYSGVSLRLLSFVLIYILLMAFLVIHTKKIKREIDFSEKKEFVKDELKEKALIAFLIIFGLGICLVLCSSFLTFLQDYTIIIIALTFLIAGIVALKICKVSFKQGLIYFKNGALDIAPSIILILMAASIKYTMEESGVINVIVEKLIVFGSSMSKAGLIAFIYLICLVLEIFIPSGSAKAFLIIPLVVPLATSYGISAQLCILAYAFGDGFSNVFYPTNPALIISLGLVNIDYKRWFKYSIGFQLANLVLTMGILFLGLAIGY